MIWPIVNMFTLGLANYVSEAVTAAFVTLYGIRVALNLKGDKRHTDFRALATYSVAFGLVLSVLKSGLMVAAIATVVYISDVTFGEIGLSWRNLQSAEEIVQGAFYQVGFPLNFLVLIPFLIFAPVILAVPMAAIAQSVGRGAHSEGIFWGVGRSFVPVFLVFLISLALQLFFGLFTIVFVMLPGLLFALMALAKDPAAFVFNLESVLIGAFSLFGLMWAQAWLWSVAALALLRAQGKVATAKAAAPDQQDTMTTDLRSLRKARENRG